ncbi:Ig-like domain-containing protein [Myroides sp. N17-2]|uniref:Ig-like domain-containing protein n=1 Tax=Myroides sp. N17-2 TaxID=2030799 RepID=UPI000EFBE9FC|nr:Ig-like domain-containing protein [Myroides sp. N17-2]
MMRSKYTLLLFLSFLFFNCSSDDNTGLKGQTPAIEFRNSECVLLLDDNLSLLKELKINDETDVFDIEWSSSNKKVINTIDIFKISLKPLDYGETTITAKIKGTNKKATLKVIVKDMKLFFTQGQVEIDMLKESTTDLTKVLDFMNLKKENLIWTTFSPAMVSVDEKGIVTGIQSGEAYVKVTVKNNKSVGASIYVVVTGVK